MSQPDRTVRILGRIAVGIYGAVLLALLLGMSGIQPRVKEDISFADFTVVVLSALGVMVAILTFFLAVLAFFGWSAFRTIIEDKFEDLFRKRFDASNKEYGDIVDRVVEDAKARQREAERPPEELPENEAEPDQEPD